LKQGFCLYQTFFPPPTPFERNSTTPSNTSTSNYKFSRFQLLSTRSFSSTSLLLSAHENTISSCLLPGTFNPSKRLYYHHLCGTALSCHLIFSGCRKHRQIPRMGQAQLRPADSQDTPRNLRTVTPVSHTVRTARTSFRWADMEIDTLAESTFLR
jgi:hypothetical protein